MKRDREREREKRWKEGGRGERERDRKGQRAGCTKKRETVPGKRRAARKRTGKRNDMKCILNSKHSLASSKDLASLLA